MEQLLRSHDNPNTHFVSENELYDALIKELYHNCGSIHQWLNLFYNYLDYKHKEWKRYQKEYYDILTHGVPPSEYTDHAQIHDAYLYEGLSDEFHSRVLSAIYYGESNIAHMKILHQYVEFSRMKHYYRAIAQGDRYAPTTWRLYSENQRRRLLEKQEKIGRLSRPFVSSLRGDMLESVKKTDKNLLLLLRNEFRVSLMATGKLLYPYELIKQENQKDTIEDILDTCYERNLIVKPSDIQAKKLMDDIDNDIAFKREQLEGIYSLPIQPHPEVKLLPPGRQDEELQETEGGEEQES